MPDARRRNCKGCRKPDSEVGPISWRGFCESCYHERVEENVEGLHTHSGAPFLRWRRAMAASVGGVLLDDVLTDP